MKRWDRTDFTILTKAQTSLTRFTSIKFVKQEDFCGAIALTLFVENCLNLSNFHETFQVLTIFLPKINQFTCHKMFVIFAQRVSLKPVQI